MARDPRLGRACLCFAFRELMPTLRAFQFLRSLRSRVVMVLFLFMFSRGDLRLDAAYTSRH